MKKLFGNLAVLGIGCMIALGVLELFLRWAQPIPSRIKGDKIVLPHNRLYQLENPPNMGLDSLVIHRKNALGFRGPAVPENWDEALSLITIGGSTTECFLLADDKDWPALLGVELKSQYPSLWVNNAGLDGHSSFGHQLLLTDYVLPLRPDVALFLLGANEVGRKDLDQYDKAQLKDNLPAWKRVLYHSEIANLVLNIQRSAKAKKLDLNHQYLELKSLSHRPTDSLAVVQLIQSDSTTLANYQKRLQALGDSCEAYGVKPVFATQPSLLGEGVDPDSGVNLATIEWQSSNGESYWWRLQAYNQVLRETAAQNDWLLIDLAELLPKRSAYFYDAIHFNNAGSEAVSKIIAKKLAPYLASHADSF
ncbi:MAG: SGNH/GDSL hydrolase family protein [Bacteroidota bacterium]